MSKLNPITDDALIPFTHGFFTRKGGISTGCYASLNCALSSADTPKATTENRRRVRAWLGIPPMQLIALKQIHSAKVIPVTAAQITPPPEGDGLVTNTPGLAISILSADCQPVLFADPKAGVIGAAHASWKGALSGVLEATLEAMETLGARRANINAVIGPAISQSAYEVGLEFHQSFLEGAPENAAFFLPNTNARFQFDLRGYSQTRLRNAGIGCVSEIKLCTYQETNDFFSYRRAYHSGEPNCGRQISVIML